MIDITSTRSICRKIIKGLLERLIEEMEAERFRVDTIGTIKTIVNVLYGTASDLEDLLPLEAE